MEMRSIIFLVILIIKLVSAAKSCGFGETILWLRAYHYYTPGIV
jgi:hypothetical protein